MCRLFHHQGSTYLVVVDRFSGWPIVAPATNGAAGLATVLNETFASFGIPETLTTDGGPEFAAHSTQALLQEWGVHHRLTSAYNPHANNRAETGVKSMKRLITGNTDPGGTLTARFAKALLVYRNCPSPDTHMSPAMCLFGHPIRDSLPSTPSKLNRRRPDRSVSDRRRNALDKRRAQGQQKWDEHTKGLTPLKCGDRVFVQNQAGRHPTKWDQTGIIVEVLQYHRYQVRMDSNGRTTLRNRKYLRRNNTPLPPVDNPLTRQYVFHQPRAQPVPPPSAPIPSQSLPTPPTLPRSPAAPRVPTAPRTTTAPTSHHATTAGATTPNRPPPKAPPRTLPVQDPPPAPRRSTRERRPVQRYGQTPT